MHKVYKSYKKVISKLETMNSVSWFLMDAAWMNNAMFLAGILAVITVTSNLLALYNRFKWVKSLGEEREWIFTKTEWDQASREDKENVTSIFIDMAIFFWITMSILWMFELPGKNVTFVIGLMFVIASSVISKMNGSSWTTPFTRFRRK